MIIYKYKLPVAPGVTKMAVPGTSNLMGTVQLQYQQPVIWLIHDENDEEKMVVNIHTYMTGQVIDPETNHDVFLGTAQLDKGDFVLHYFMEVPKDDTL